MATTTSSSASVPKNIGPYRVNGLIGSGGMGVVFDATAEDGTHVALKVINPKGDSHQRQMLTARLLREAKLLQQVDHEGIVRLYDSGSVSDLVYLALEFVEGVTLDDVRRRDVAPELGFVIEVGRQLTEAVLKLHKAGVTHRDIKPSNVLIDRTGRVILIDFGIARSEEGTSITSTGEILGSPGYVAPELLEGGRSSELTDQFALGKLLFEVASSPPKDKIPRGTPVLVRFALRLHADWTRFPEDPSWEPLASIIRKMISIEPSDRYSNLADVHSALVELERTRAEKPAGIAATDRANAESEESSRSSSASPESASMSSSAAARSGAKARRASKSPKTPEERKESIPSNDSRECLRRFLRELSIQPRSPWRNSDRSGSHQGTASEASRGSRSASVSIVAPAVKPQPRSSRAMVIGALAFVAAFGLGELAWIARDSYASAARRDALGAELFRDAKTRLAADDLTGAEEVLVRCVNETEFPSCRSQLERVQLIMSGKDLR